MFHGMVQNTSLEDLFHSIVEGAVEAEVKFICAALQCHLGGPMSRDKGPRTKEACMFHGMVQNKALEHLFRRSCVALPTLHRGPLFVTLLLVESWSAEELWDLPRWADRRSPPAALLHATA